MVFCVLMLFYKWYALCDQIYLKRLPELGFDQRTSGLWAHHASTALFYLCHIPTLDAFLFQNFFYIEHMNFCINCSAEKYFISFFYVDLNRTSNEVFCGKVFHVIVFGSKMKFKRFFLFGSISRACKN